MLIKFKEVNFSLTYYKQEWLPHLKDAFPPDAKRNRTSLYTIALEGWRRGLHLKFYSARDYDERQNIRYSLSNETKTHYFNGSSGDFNSEQAFAICDNKALTAEYLEAQKVPIPKGFMFKEDAGIDEILNYVEKIQYPIVVKPTDGSGGAGVFANINSKKDLVKAVNFIREKQNFKEIIIQQHVFGEEVRVYVLDNKVLAAANRLPANVLGDGEQTVVQLVRNKNELRKSIPHLHYRPIKIDLGVRQLVEAEGYTLDSVLPKGERLYLKKISNISTGGDPVDITNELTQEQREIAVNATKAIPGLTHSGVDIIINQETGKTVVLEVNTRPGIGSHLFPVEGTAVDIPEKVIDYYFPESINIKRANEYFSLQIAFDSLQSNSLEKVEISPAPRNELVAKLYIINSDLEATVFYSHIKKYIIERNIHGEIQQTNSSEVLHLIAAHENINELEALYSFLEKRKDMLQIKKIKEELYNKPIKIGFEVIDGLSTMSFLELENEYKEKVKEKRITEREVIRLNQRINLVEKSRAWKMTAP